MTRLFLTAGVAALAIAAPATAGPGGHGGGHGGQHAARAQPQQRAQKAAPQRMQRAALQRAAMRPQRAQMRAERQQRPAAMQRQARVADRQQVRVDHKQQAQTRGVNRQQVRADHGQQAQARQHVRADHGQQAQAHQQVRVNRGLTMPNRMEARRQMQANRQVERVNRQVALQNNIAIKQQLKGIRQMTVQNRVAALQNMREGRFAALNVSPQVRILAPTAASALIGVPLASAATISALSSFPQSAQYLYPSTPNYYYQYGDGYAYQVNRGSNLISALIPLLAGGYMPGQYLPTSYMNSYAPENYGFNSFYPANSSYGCNRYVNGVVYQVQCDTGLVDNVLPLYAGGYGAGQMLPSSYDYYNVPSQYRTMYPASANNGYWYSPGAIYQYDQSSSLITSVAALLSPGMSIGQQLPTGYGAYNVPYAYRSSYADTQDAWYRYNNGYIYQVDPTTRLVSAIVASVLT